MMRLSVNVLSSAMILLKKIEDCHFSSLAELAYAKTALVDSESVFLFSKKCGWVCDDNGIPNLSSRGTFLLTLVRQERKVELRRQMLTDYVLKVSPIWSNRIPFGRREASIYMTEDEKACFCEAALLIEKPDSSIVDWWDNISNRIREKAQIAKDEIGRRGEKATIQYEKARTSSEPKWISIDTNLAGYDVLSQKSKDNRENLLIEVKASSMPLESASFHITSNEWDVARTNDAYVFYLWSFGNNNNQLAIINPEKVRPYIPTNNLNGKWETAEIPFSSFGNDFFEVRIRGGSHE